MPHTKVPIEETTYVKYHPTVRSGLVVLELGLLILQFKDIMHLNHT